MARHDRTDVRRVYKASMLLTPILIIISYDLFTATLQFM